MKLNNKGFAISGVLYSLLILFVTLFIGILTILATTKFSLDKVKRDITDKLQTLAYRDTILNGADPVLREGMIPVTIDADGTVKKADITSAWYDYDTKMWANAITVSETNRSTYDAADSGTIIPENDILTYFVWIPRYRYRLWYVGAIDGHNGYVDETQIHSIDIIFESKNTAKSNGSQNGQYLTHPAFTFEEELNGIWVGKFETGYNGDVDLTEAEIDNVDSSQIIIKPNVYSWRNVSVSTAFYTALNMNSDDNIFGIMADSDTHMMKNIEWGAAAYLSHSAYGKNSEVHINNNNDADTNLTGCGGIEADSAATTACDNQYGYQLAYPQSTTGNITGIFDMSGGAWEYVMGYNTNATVEYDSSGFSDDTFPAPKYVDLYSTSSYTQYSNRILGDATGELGPFNSDRSSWYDDYAAFASVAGNSWFRRGGRNLNTLEAGIMGFSHHTGAGDSANSFRIVLV